MNVGRHGVAILADPEIEGALVREIDGDGDDLVVVRRCADLAEVRAAARSGVADLAVLDSDDPDLDAAVLEDLHEAGMSVVLLAETDQRARLRLLGADAVERADAPASVVESLLDLVRAPDLPSSVPDERGGPGTVPRPPPPPPGEHGPNEGQAGRRGAEGDVVRGRTIVVWGTSGAPGRSTVAVNLAVALARTGSVLLLDADTHAPSIAHMLGLSVDVSSMAALARAVSHGSLTLGELTRASQAGPDGIGVVTGLSAPHRWRELSPAALREIMGAARRCADIVLVDVAAAGVDPAPERVRHQGGRDDLVGMALREADTVVMIGRGDAIGVNRMDLALQWWADLGSPAELVPVINQASAASAGARPVNAIAEALVPMLHGEVVHVIPRDPEVEAALLRARCLVEAAPRSPAGAALLDLAAFLAGRRSLHTAPGAGSRSDPGSSGWFQVRRLHPRV